MAVASISWNFATDLSPSSSSLGLTGTWSGMDATPNGWDASGAFYWLYQSTTVGRLIVGPPSGTLWTPDSITFKIRRNISGTIEMNVSWGGDYTIDTKITGVTSSYTTKTVDLSGIGEVDGPIDLRFWGAGSSSSTRYLMDDVTLTGDVSTGADASILPGGIVSGEAFGSATVDAPLPSSVSPTGIASAEDFGAPVVVVIQPVNLEPAAISSGEAFGSASVVIVQPQIVSPGGVGSGEAFGVPEVAYGAAVPVVAYPTAEDVSVFLTGSEVDDRLVAMAAVHIGVVTHFARVYTRGNGFYVDGVTAEIASVILAATARLASNPGQIDITIGSVRRQGSFKGWTLAEQKVLNPYRKVAL